MINPVDKARKEARKKELKKNKKQRQLVRSAAIEKRDPEQIIAELEKLDRIEFDVATSLKDAFYKDKRKRLKEVFAKILIYYEKEDPERHTKLKKLESDYEANYKRISKEFEAIKAAQEVKIEDVFLPPEPTTNVIAIDEIPDDDPLMSESVYVTHEKTEEGLKPPGCPPGFPPDLKLIVDALKTSLIASMPLNLPVTLPPDLANLPLPRQQQTTRPIRGRGGHQGATRYNINNQKQQQLQRNKPSNPASTGFSITKAAVIESKPVLFKPKATKFLPSSLRSKVNRDEKKE